MASDRSGDIPQPPDKAKSRPLIRPLLSKPTWYWLKKWCRLPVVFKSSARAKRIFTARPVFAASKAAMQAH